MIILKYSFNFTINSNILADITHEAVIQRHKITSLEYFLSSSFISNTSYPYAMYMLCVYLLIMFSMGQVPEWTSLEKLIHFYSITVSKSIYGTGSMRLLLL